MARVGKLLALNSDFNEGHDKVGLVEGRTTANFQYLDRLCSGWLVGRSQQRINCLGEI